jgi:hypothetical protein
MRIAGTGPGNLVEGNTIFANQGASSAGAVSLVYGSDSHITFRANAVVYNFASGVRCYVAPGGHPSFECNDIHGNAPANFVDDQCGPVWGVNNNFNADPMFGRASGCPLAEGDLCLQEGSPLLPENSPPGCGLIGARGLCPPIGVGGMDPEQPDRLSWSVAPNPSSGAALMRVEISAPSEVEIIICDVRGEVVRSLRPGPLAPGRHSLMWDGRDAAGRRCASGAYFASVRAGGRTAGGRFLLLH